jgi:uncharacterized membrane protein YphA (DoxX/SURF4 family)
MLASFFVVNGVNAVRKPDAYVSEAEPVTSRLVPLVQRVIPPTAAVHLPEETRAWVRIVGGAQIAGGAMLASGLGRRCGAGILAATMVPHVVASNPLASPASERRERASNLLRNVALLGGVLLAAFDTEGKPGIAWRIDDKRKDATAALESAGKNVTAAAEGAGKKASRAAKKAGKKAVKAGKLAQREAKSVSKMVQDTLR